MISATIIEKRAGIVLGLFLGLEPGVEGRLQAGGIKAREFRSDKTERSRIDVLRSSVYEFG